MEGENAQTALRAVALSHALRAQSIAIYSDPTPWEPQVSLHSMTGMLYSVFQAITHAHVHMHRSTQNHANVTAYPPCRIFFTLYYTLDITHDLLCVVY